jgi:hypothetical protein
MGAIREPHAPRGSHMLAVCTVHRMGPCDARWEADGAVELTVMPFSPYSAVWERHGIGTLDSIAAL